MYVYMRRECVQVAEREFAACPDGAVQGRFITSSEVLDFMQFPQLPSKNPRVLRLRGKHACIQGKKTKKRNNLHIYTQTWTEVFFSCLFSQIKM